MLSRRLFILGSLFAAAELCLGTTPEVFAKAKKPKGVPQQLGPRSLARAEWPPSIAPDFVEVVDRGYALLSDQSGRLAIVDFKREDGPSVISEVSGLGKKIVDISLTPQRCYVLAYQEVGTDANFSLVIINLAPITDPTVMARVPLPYFSEPTCIAASADTLCIAGTGRSGENLIAVYPVVSGKRRGDSSAPNMTPMATLAMEQPVTKMDLQDRLLVALQAGMPTQLDVINLMNPRMPQRIKTVKMEGNFNVLSRLKEVMLVAGQRNDRKYEAKLISLKPTPKLVATVPLAVSEIFDTAVQKGQFLLLGNQNQRQVVLPLTYNKALQAKLAAPVVLPAGGKNAVSKASIAVTAKEAYVASDWGGVQVLSISPAGWQYAYSHTIPRMPAAAVAVATNKVILGGADLKLYDISNPERPILQDSTDLGSIVKSVVGIGDRILVLTRDSLSLRRTDKPSDLIYTTRVQANTLAYDPTQNRAFLLSGKGKDKTLLTAVDVSGSLSTDKPQEIQGSFSRLSACGGAVALSGLSDIALYDVGSTAELRGSRTFPNFAIRDLSLCGDKLILTAVDQNLKGFFLVVSTTKSDLPTVGSIDLPQDAAALAVAGNKAVVVGRNPEGKDLATILDISNSVMPKVIASFPVVEAAAAVSIRDKLAIVGGRGLEILTLG